MTSMSGSGRRPLIGLIWLLVFAILLIGGYKLFHLDHRSPDQRILLKDTGRH